MKFLIIHGPNMNLLGLYSKTRLTLDKLNRSIKRHIKDIDLETKISQTHDEKKFISLLHTNRNKVDAFILNIGPWHPTAHLIKETLHILKVPYLIVEHDTKNIEGHHDLLKNSVFDSNDIIKDDNIEKAYIKALNQLLNK
tara:strand:- start:40 stop:459 length:420 start_codon:yes stop_codon:yes gene_type:complete